MLEVTDLAVWYPTRGIALDRLSFVVAPGEIRLLTGRNGAGGSTALAAIRASLPAGARRRGRIRLDEVEITGAHPDDLHGVIAMVGDAEPNPALRVRDLFGRNVRRAAGRGAPIAPAALLERLGLSQHLATRVAEASDSLFSRAALAAALLSAPRVLLADQPLAPLESRWREPVCELLRQYADAGMAILWAEHQLVHALAVADSVIELDRPETRPHPDQAQPSAQPAWSWRPRTLPFTPVQQVTSALGLVAPGADRIENLQASLNGRLSGVSRPVTARREPSRLTVRLNEREHLLVRDDQVVRIACPSAEVAVAVYRRLTATNGFEPAAPRRNRRLAEICQEQDRRLGRQPGTTANLLVEMAPGLRIRDAFGRHSGGEQALIAALLDLDRGPVVPLLEPGRRLDAATRSHLGELARRELTRGRMVIEVTTDAEEWAAGERVIVHDETGVVADGRAMAIWDALPHLPRLTAACWPHRLADAAEVIAAAGVGPEAVR